VLAGKVIAVLLVTVAGEPAVDVLAFQFVVPLVVETRA
jgi:hypothetical protein